MARGLMSVRRPLLLQLVLAGSLALTAVTAAGAVVVAREHVVASALNASLAADSRVVERFALVNLTASDLEGGASLPRGAQVERSLHALLGSADLLAASITDGAGTTLFRAIAEGHELADRVTGSHGPSPSARLVQGRTPPSVLVETLPILGADGAPIGTFMLERDATPILAGVDQAVRDMGAVLLAGAVLCAGVLTLIFRAAHQRLGRQTQQLLEATRRDPVTGLLNHGAIVEELSSVLEAARRQAGWLIVAIIDVDNFRLLNETHGHAAGDEVLRRLARALAAEAPPEALFGRYGPDEFLLIGPPACAPAIRPAVDRLRERIRRQAVRFSGSELLPVTVSAGVASYPEHAAAMAELLSAATRMLVDAKTGGGDRVLVDAPDDEVTNARWRTFDVLQGLVVAIDTKDHYTKMHSEDVARYARYLTEELGLDEGLREAVSVAGLLHDVGKIGVPDQILRKPAPLTAEEKDVVASHAVIGHLIVSSLPGMELVSAGVRHHHERWDGNGYPDGLAGDDIPRIARIVAVADVFSAMRTSRPYRKALPIEEALSRILDAAGSQLDPSLAERFVAAVRRLPDGELPAEHEPVHRAWRAGLKVA
jgi:diguanylate cyclase (GGDEF)-like protein